MNTVRAFVALVFALGLAALGGWCVGTRGRSTAEAALVDSGVRQHAAGARINLLQARVDLFEQNFGDAATSLAAARSNLVTLEGAFTRAQRTHALRAVHEAMALVSEAQQQAGRLDAEAHASVAKAGLALSAALAAAT